MRPRISVVPPGAKATTTRTGFAGYVWADAVVATTVRSTSRARVAFTLVMTIAESARQRLRVRPPAAPRCAAVRRAPERSGSAAAYWRPSADGRDPVRSPRATWATWNWDADSRSTT